MLLSQTIAALTLVANVLARPSGQYVSILTGNADAIRDLPIGKTPISRDDMEEMARLAIAVNTAYCPMDRQLQPHPTPEPSQQGRHQRADSVKHASSIIISSQDPEFASQVEEVDMSWYISHTPATQTLTLAFSSLPSTDDMLDLLASTPYLNATLEDNLVDLPSYLFPQQYLPQNPAPAIYHAYLPALETHGTSALLALLDLIETPPMPISTNTNVLQNFVNKLTHASEPVEVEPIRRVEIVGHGLGASMATLVSLALHLEVSGPAADSYVNPLPVVSVSTTLFGAPRVGDAVFAAWVDELQLQSPELRINRVTSYADSIAHLPERHLDLVHPSIGEVWVGADPRIAYACRAESEGEESEECGASIPLQKTSLLDHAGPFGGVWIGQSKCRRPQIY